MKKIAFFILTSLLVMGCVTNSKKVEAELVIITDKFKIEKGLEKKAISSYLLPQLVDCEKPISIQPNSKIVRINNEKREELEIKFEKNFFQQLFDAKLDEEKGRRELAKYKVPNEWKTVDFKSSKNEITKYVNEIDEESLILTDKDYQFLMNKNKIIIKNKEDYKKVLKDVFCGEAMNLNKIYIFDKIKSFETIIPPPDSIHNPCKTKTISGALELKDDLLKIIDTKRSYKERDVLAKQIWKKYFDSMASIYMYSRPNQIHEKFWESGDGINYLVDRLAYKNSITDLNIVRAEFHRETNKISSITIVECHNASEVR